jgi:type I restriction enzyme R subunit
MMTRQQRIIGVTKTTLDDLEKNEKEFIEFVLSKYQQKGVEELGEEKLPILLNLKYHAIANAEQSLGSVENIRSIFFELQKDLYAKKVKV